MSAISIEVDTQTPTFSSALFVTGLGVRLLCIIGLFLLSQLDGLSLPVLAAALATDLFAFIWQLIRFNTAAGLYFHNSGRFWTITGGYMLFLAFALVMVSQWWVLYRASDMAMQRKSAAQETAIAPSRKAERFKLAVSKDLKTLSFTGVVAQSTLSELRPVLNRVPELETLVLNSAGGNVYAARDVAREVLARDLNTHVDRECSASCTLIFTAGNERTLGPGAELGFHRYGLDFMQLLPHLDVEKELPKERQYYLGRGISSDFVSRALDPNSAAIWVPGRSVLYNAGVLTQP